MKNWIKEETFEKLNVVPKQLFYQEECLQKDMVRKQLLPQLHMDLYEFFNLGGEVMFRHNQEGEIELLTLINDIDPLILAKSRVGIDNIKIDTNRFEFQFLIYDRADDPLRLPFIFELNDDVQRYCVAALCEQREIPFYFLQSDNQSLTVSFCRIISWPDEVRQAFRDLVLEAYQYSNKEEDIVQSETSNITDEELTSNGWAYQFDLNKLKEQHGDDENVNAFIRNTIFECVQLISNSKYKGVKEGPFLIWMFQRKGVFEASGNDQEAIVIVITPFYNDRSPRATREIEPCYELLQSIEGFIRVESANPLFENAIPLFRYEKGDLKKIELDSALLDTAANLLDELLAFNGVSKEKHLNIYRYLLENR